MHLIARPFNPHHTGTDPAPLTHHDPHAAQRQPTAHHTQIGQKNLGGTLGNRVKGIMLDWDDAQQKQTDPRCRSNAFMDAFLRLDAGDNTLHEPTLNEPMAALSEVRRGCELGVYVPIIALVPSGRAHRP